MEFKNEKLIYGITGIIGIIMSYTFFNYPEDLRLYFNFSHGFLVGMGFIMLTGGVTFIIGCLSFFFTDKN